MVDTVSGMACEKSESSEDEGWDINLTEACSTEMLSVNDTGCFCRGPGFGPQHPCCL